MPCAANVVYIYTDSSILRITTEHLCIMRALRECTLRQGQGWCSATLWSVIVCHINCRDSQPRYSVSRNIYGMLFRSVNDKISEKLILDPDKHQILIPSRGSPLVHVWSTFVNAFVSYSGHTQNEWQSQRSRTGWPLVWKFRQFDSCQGFY